MNADPLSHSEPLSAGGHRPPLLRNQLRLSLSRTGRALATGGTEKSTSCAESKRAYR